MNPPGVISFFSEIKWGDRVAKSNFNILKKCLFLTFFGLKYCIFAKIYTIFWLERQRKTEEAFVNLLKVIYVFQK